MVKRIIYIFIIAFALNFAWEHIHSVLYVHYKSGEITNAILMRAAIFDAIFITILSLFYLRIAPLKHRLWLTIFLALIFAIGLEIWATNAGRWAYAESMPIIPIIGTGLTPTIQLALTAFLSIITSRKLTGPHIY